MKTMTITGIVLIIVGTASLIYGGFSYKKKEPVFQLGDVKVTAERTKRVPISPLFGAIAIGSGLVLLLIGKKSSRQG